MLLTICLLLLGASSVATSVALVAQGRRLSALSDLCNKVYTDTCVNKYDVNDLSLAVDERFEAVWAELEKKANSRAARKPKDSSADVSESN